QPKWPNEAARAVEVQRRFQSRPPALLSPFQMGHKHYILRELQPMADRVDLTTWGGKVQRLEKFVHTVADVLAWGQLRSSGRQGSATSDELIAFASTQDWQSQLMHSAQKSAARVEAEFKVYSKAYDHGELQNG